MEDRRNRYRLRTEGWPKERGHEVARIDHSRQSRPPEIGIRASAYRDHCTPKEASEEATDGQRCEVLCQTRAQDKKSKYWNSCQIYNSATIVLADGCRDDGSKSESPKKERKTQQRHCVGGSKMLRNLIGSRCVYGRGERPGGMSQMLYLELRNVVLTR